MVVLNSVYNLSSYAQQNRLQQTCTWVITADFSDAKPSGFWFGQMSKDEQRNAIQILKSQIHANQVVDHCHRQFDFIVYSTV